MDGRIRREEREKEGRWGRKGGGGAGSLTHVPRQLASERGTGRYRAVASDTHNGEESDSSDSLWLV